MGDIVVECFDLFATGQENSHLIRKKKLIRLPTDS